MSLASPFQATSSRRRFFSARRATSLALVALGLLGGCATPSTPEAAPATVAPDWQPSPNRFVGQVQRVDLALGHVVIEMSPYAEAPPVPGDLLISRTADLRVTAQLRVGPFRRGRIIGAAIIAGQPRRTDEVVLPPAAPPAR